MITIILFFIFVLTLILYYFLSYYGKSGMIKLIPGPRSFPIIGNIPQILSSPSEIWTSLIKMGNDYYPIFRIWTFFETHIHICHPDDIETILGNTKFIKKGFAYKYLESWFNTGLLTSSGHKWHVRRKILTPAFHFNILRQFVDIFIEDGERLIKVLRSKNGIIIPNLLQFISEHTLNVLCETAMGTSLKDKGTFQYKYHKAVYDMGCIFVYRITRPWFYYDFFFNLSPQGWKQSKLLKILHNFTRKIIQERKKYHDQTNGRYLTDFNENTNENDNENDLGIRRKRLAMLDLLIEAHRNDKIDDEGIREEVDTFMFRGHDTTAIAFCFSVMLLAEHKDIQNRIRTEVKAVIDENGGKLNMSTLQNLPYLERCIKETLRLYPSVPLISRKLEGDVKLSNYEIPANNIINIQIFNTHRDPKFWPNPDKFDPDRFLPENSKGRHPFAYIPFSAGPRNCIGQRFAILELKTYLALLLYNYYFEPIDYLKDITISLGILLRLENPIRMKFIPVKKTY
ncbi:cytochrome P450 4C1-like [Apis cerana]|uniref:cytochrome P450 4C1-like n=1 Tax=Apis cerana TaxID=7461 RepID=UPI002B2335DB|nr:cytochrome P450 4C1-like [Apis cerana]